MGHRKPRYLQLMLDRRQLDFPAKLQSDLLDRGRLCQAERDLSREKSRCRLDLGAPDNKDILVQDDFNVSWIVVLLWRRILAFMTVGMRGDVFKL